MSIENEAIVKISKLFEEIGVPSMVVGASARDILARTYNLPLTMRMTSDVDFGILVKDWDELKRVQDYLKKDQKIKKIGEKENKVRYHYSGLPFDIVPFGGIEKDYKVSWPPFYDTIMTVLGYEEALNHSIAIKINGKEIKVVASEMLIALKLIAWDENSSREKDIADSWFLIKNYEKLEPSAYEYILDNHLSLFEEFGLEPDISAPLYVGIKLKKLLKKITREHLREILYNDRKLEKIASIVAAETFMEMKEDQIKLVLKYLKALRRGLE